MMEYAIKAHPTTYAGVEFRSRLEATWAAFFDLTGWKWKYEPIDLHGWTPDFEVSHPDHHADPILVEVKPSWAAAQEVLPKIKASGVPKALMLSNGPSVPEDEGIDWTWGMAGSGPKGKLGYPLGVLCYFGGSEPDYGDHAISFYPRLVADDPWKEASNLTRWRAR